MRWIVSFLPPIENETEHIKQKEDGTWVVRIDGEVLLGKLSFQMITEDEFDISGFELVADAESSPNTGITISVDGNKNTDLEEQDRFVFIDKMQSEEKDVFLNNMIISNTKENPEDSENPIYKEYNLTPEFNKETNQYEITLLEYIDDIDLKAILSDEKSSMKVRVPKRDDEGNLVYEADGSTLVYEERELLNDTSQNIMINELGEQDTIITVIVTADDGTTTNEYQVTIHRPYGTIKGSIQLGAELRDSIDMTYGTYVKYLANVKAYKTGEFNWDGILAEETTFEELDNLEIQRRVETNEDDGSYTMYIIPGEYDVIIEREGFLAQVVTQITINENDEIELGARILLEGDVDRNGMIDILDLVEVTDRMDSMKDDGIYEEKADFGQKGFTDLLDLVSVMDNMDTLIEIEKYM